MSSKSSRTFSLRGAQVLDHPVLWWVKSHLRSWLAALRVGKAALLWMSGADSGFLVLTLAPIDIMLDRFTDGGTYFPPTTLWVPGRLGASRKENGLLKNKMKMGFPSWTYRIKTWYILTGLPEHFRPTLISPVILTYFCKPPTSQRCH